MARSVSVVAPIDVGSVCWNSQGQEGASMYPTDAGPAPIERPCILVIDDDELLLYTFKRILGHTYEVVLAKSGEDGLERLAASVDSSPGEYGLDSDRIQAIICDMQMPRLDGRAVYAAIEEQFPSFLSRVILCTGGSIDGAFAERLAQNDAKILHKPCTADEIFNAVASLMG